jgi:hypothetical protein
MKMVTAMTICKIDGHTNCPREGNDCPPGCRPLRRLPSKEKEGAKEETA